MKALMLALALLSGVAMADAQGTDAPSHKPYRPTYRTDGAGVKPRNVILLISDGAGLSEIWAAATANHGTLNVMNCRNNGYVTTRSASAYITDSAASGTAIATGRKTSNGHVGVDSVGRPMENIVERLSGRGMACGIVSNDLITGATPSAFYAHVGDRDQADSIMMWLDRTPAMFVIAGGDPAQPTMQTLAPRLDRAGMVVCEGIDKLAQQPADKRTVCFDTDRYDEGFRLIEAAFDECVGRLAVDPDGFFLMMEGCKIDHGGHDNDLGKCVDEYLSFDRLVGRAMEFADRDGQTLVVVMSDHETGGLVVLDGNYATGEVEGKFTTDYHTGVPVPVFSYGAGSDRFTGFVDNTEIVGRILSLLE
jgi:alkaline phosphatase